MKIKYLIALSLLISVLVLPQLLEAQPDQIQNVDFGQLFVEAINSVSELRQNEIIGQIFADSIIKEKGFDRIRGLFIQLKGGFAPLSYHHSEVSEFSTTNGIRYTMHVYAKKKGATKNSNTQR